MNASRKLLMTARFAELMAVFLFAKTAGLIHEEVHPFHHHSESCDIFQALAHHASDEVYEPQVAFAKPAYQLEDTLVFPQQHFISYPAFWGRAPPRFS